MMFTIIIYIYFQTCIRARKLWSDCEDAQASLSSPGPVVIKLFSCSTQLNMKLILLINVKMPTTVGILTFISMINQCSI